MAEEKQQRTLRLRPRQIILGIGIFLIILALFANQIGLSASDGFGTGQIMILSVGIFLTIIGVLWQHTGTVYQTTAVILLNTIVFIVLLELLLIGGEHLSNWVSARVSSLSRPASTTTDEPATAAEPAETTASDIQASNDQNWQSVYKREDNETSVRYEAFTIWRRRPYSGQTVNVNERGNRLTTGATCTDEAFTVFMFGGSTTWGTGVPDWYTIPSYLQPYFSETYGEACVVNFGESGYISTQGVITLMIELQKGNVPDMVIFYDGVNDVSAAFRNNQAYTHIELDSISGTLEQSSNMVNINYRKILLNTHVGRLIGRFVPNLTAESGATEALTDNLASQVADAYLTNYQIIDGMADQFGFEFYFFLQPLSLVDSKPLTGVEQQLRDGRVALEIQLYEDTYAFVIDTIEAYPNLYYIGDVFNDYEALVYIDYMHLNPQGNRLVAERMLEIIDLNNVLDETGE